MCGESSEVVDLPADTLSSVYIFEGQFSVEEDKEELSDVLAIDWQGEWIRHIASSLKR